MTNKEALNIIKEEALYHANIASAMNEVYRQITGVDVDGQNPEGKIRALPSVCEKLGLGTTYRIPDRKN